MVKQLSRQLKKIEAKENTGAYGVWRKDFCKRYLELLVRTRNNTYRSLLETLAAEDGIITCRKGCTHCCFHYIAVSLTHGMVIVNYLYKRKELLEQFLDNYRRWHGEGYRISENIDHARIQAFSSSMPIDQVIAITRPLSRRYFEMNIQCPFLVDDKCIIYEFRPLPCSGHYSVSPPNRCASVARQEPVIRQLIPNDEDLSEMVLLTDPRLTFYELTLPTMIHKILMEGASSIITAMVQ